MVVTLLLVHHIRYFYIAGRYRRSPALCGNASTRNTNELTDKFKASQETIFLNVFASCDQYVPHHVCRDQITSVRKVPRRTDVSFDVVK